MKKNILILGLMAIISAFATVSFAATLSASSQIEPRGVTRDGVIRFDVKNTATGKSITLDMMLSDTVESLKRKIADKEGYLVDQISLTYAGKPLEDGLTLSHYNIYSGSTVMMKIR